MVERDENGYLLKIVSNIPYHPWWRLTSQLAEQHWILLGLSGLEQRVLSVPKRAKSCFGGAPSLADVFLVPQLYNARRFGCDLSRCPSLVKIDANVDPHAGHHEKPL